MVVLVYFILNCLSWNGLRLFISITYILILIQTPPNIVISDWKWHFCGRDESRKDLKPIINGIITQKLRSWFPVHKRLLVGYFSLNLYNINITYFIDTLLSL